MTITEVTRQALITLFNGYALDPAADALEAFVGPGVSAPSRGICWHGQLDEIAFLSRLYDLDELPSTDARYTTAREDIHQHRLNNLDWEDDWIFVDTRFELASSDERLLRFLSETLHPAVRPDRGEVERLRGAYNRILRPDRREIRPTGSVSGRPLFAGGLAVPRNVQPDQLRHAIGQAIRHGLSASNVPALCDELRMPALPTHSTADPMSSKAGYVFERIANLDWPDLVSLARVVIERHYDDDLSDMVFEIDLKAVDGVAGAPKNIIFAADGPKPDLALVDAVNNDIQIMSNAEHCLVYDRSIDADRGLTFSELVDWWTGRHGISEPSLAANSLYERLSSGLNLPERVVLAAYKRILQQRSFALPAILPQVYLHYDPHTIRARLARDGRRLERQRMDFLLLAPGRRRIVVELDGIEHYAENRVASPRRYAAMMREDRRLMLAGYEVFRFGGYEFVDHDSARTMMVDFFAELLDRMAITS